MSMTTMDSEYHSVLSIPRPEHGADEAAFVLLKVESAGRRQLDLKLIGTEEENVFAITLKHSQISSLRSKSSHSSQDEWEEILLSVLRGVSPANETLVQGVEAIAKVERKASSLTITIQKVIEGITQKLGTISIPATPDEELSLYDWCNTVITSKDSTSQELHSLKAILKDKDAQVEKLEKGLAELVLSKTAHESALLEKFSLLLNEKKLKIRDQQRLLSGSTVDTGKLETLVQHRGSRSRSAGPSRKGKRKAGAVEDDSSDEGFEKMDEVEEAVVNSDSEQEGRRTPDADSTASEVSDDDGPPVSSAKASERQEVGVSSSATAAPDKEDKPLTLPPRRDLPFQQKTVVKTKPQPVADGSDTESDDEL